MKDESENNAIVCQQSLVFKNSVNALEKNPDNGMLQNEEQRMLQRSGVLCTSGDTHITSHNSKRRKTVNRQTTPGIFRLKSSYKGGF